MFLDLISGNDNIENIEETSPEFEPLTSVLDNDNSNDESISGMSDLVSVGSPIQSCSKENHDATSNGFESDKNSNESLSQIPCESDKNLIENSSQIPFESDQNSIENLSQTAFESDKNSVENLSQTALESDKNSIETPILIDFDKNSVTDIKKIYDTNMKLEVSKVSNNIDKPKTNDSKFKSKHQSSRRSKHSSSQEKSNSHKSKDRSSNSQSSSNQDKNDKKKSSSSSSKDRKSSSRSKHHSESKEKDRKHRHDKKSHHSDRDKTPKRDRKDSRSDKKEKSSSLCKEPKSLNGNKSDDESNAGGSSKSKSNLHINKSSTSDKSKSSSSNHKSSRKDNSNKDVVDKLKDKSSTSESTNSSSHKSSQSYSKKRKHSLEKRYKLPMNNQNVKKKEVESNDFHKFFRTNDEEDAANVLIAMSAIPFEGSLHNEVRTENIIFVENSSPDAKILATPSNIIQKDSEFQSNSHETIIIQSCKNDNMNENNDFKMTHSCDSFNRKFCKEDIPQIKNSFENILTSECNMSSYKDLKLPNCTKSFMIASEQLKQLVGEEKVKTLDVKVDSIVNTELEKKSKDNELLNDDNQKLKSKVDCSINENETLKQIILPQFSSLLDEKPSFSNFKVDNNFKNVDDKSKNTINAFEIITAENFIVQNNDMTNKCENKINEPKKNMLLINKHTSILDKKENIQIPMIIDKEEELKSNCNLDANINQKSDTSDSTEISKLSKPALILKLYSNQIDSNKKAKRKMLSSNHDSEVKKCKLSKSNKLNLPIHIAPNNKLCDKNVQKSVHDFNVVMNDSKDKNNLFSQMIKNEHENKVVVELNDIGFKGFSEKELSIHEKINHYYQLIDIFYNNIIAINNFNFDNANENDNVNNDCNLNNNNKGFKGFTSADLNESKNFLNTIRFQLLKLKHSIGFEGFSKQDVRPCVMYEPIKKILKQLQRPNIEKNQQNNSTCHDSRNGFNKIMTVVYENTKDDKNVNNRISNVYSPPIEDSNTEICPAVNNNNHHLTSSNHWVVEQEMKYKLLPVKVKLERLFDISFNSEYTSVGCLFK